MARKILSIVLCCCLSAVELCWCLTMVQMISSNQALASDGKTNCEGEGKYACEQIDADLEAYVQKNGSGMGQSELDAERARLQEAAKNDKNKGVIVDMGSGSGSGSGSGGGVSAAYGTDEFWKVLMALAIAVEGVVSGFACGTQGSSATFGTVSAIYLIGELIHTANAKKASERKLSIINHVSQDMITAQSDALQIAIDETKAAAAHVSWRADFTMVMAVGYVICAILAFSEGFLGPLSVCPAIGVWWKNPDLEQNIYSILLPFLGISEAQGGDLFKPLGIEGALEGKFWEALAVVKTGFSSATLNGYTRGVVYSVFADFCIKAADVMKERKKRLLERVRIYQILLKKLKAKSATPDVIPKDPKIKSLGNNGVEAPDSSSLENEIIDPLKGKCATGDLTKNLMAADLDCKEKPMVIDGITEIPTNPIVDLPGSVLDGAKKTKDFARDLAGGKGITGQMREFDHAAYARFNKIKAEIGRKLLDFSKKKDNAENLASIDDAEKDMRDKMVTDMKAALSKYPPEQINSLVGQLMGGEPPEVKELLDPTKNDIQNKKLSNVSPIAIKNLVPKIKLEDEDSNENAAIESAGELSSADALQNLNYKENDISDDTGASLFLIITNRYRKTAYPLIFDKNGSDKGKGP